MMRVVEINNFDSENNCMYHESKKEYQLLISSMTNKIDFKLSVQVFCLFVFP